MTSQTKIITANWTGSEYLCYDLADYPDGIISQCGDIWRDADGRLVTGQEFEAATTRLVGGPRDNEVVA